MIDLRTPKEKARDEKHRAIISDYLSLAQSYPSYAATRLMGKVAEKHGMRTNIIKDYSGRDRVAVCEKEEDA